MKTKSKPLSERLMALVRAISDDDEFNPPEDWEVGEVLHLLTEASGALENTHQ